MVFRRCPQCGSTSDDQYGFCIKCGYEFPKIKKLKYECPLCGYQNPDEAEYCVKCGTPLAFQNPFAHPEGNVRPIVITKEEVNAIQSATTTSTTSQWLILAGYIFSILGGILGLIIAIYLSIKKDPVARKHGHIQLAIFGFYILLIVILIATGALSPDLLTNYQDLVLGNVTLP